MPANVEIKARVRDWEPLVRTVEELSDSPVQVLHQEDTFFRVPRGRLKLRVRKRGRESLVQSPQKACTQTTPDAFPGIGELIFYEREDAAEPTPSHYLIARTHDPESLKCLLTARLGLRGTVRKIRRLYRIGQARIHLDEVEDLGRFIELEVVLDDGQSPADGVSLARDLINRLDIHDADLVKEAYVDLLTQQCRAERTAGEHER